MSGLLLGLFGGWFGCACVGSVTGWAVKLSTVLSVHAGSILEGDSQTAWDTGMNQPDPNRAKGFFLQDTPRYKIIHHDIISISNQFHLILP